MWNTLVLLWKKTQKTRPESYIAVKPSWGTQMGTCLTALTQLWEEQHKECLTEDANCNESELSEGIWTPLCKFMAQGLLLKWITSFRIQKSESTCLADPKSPFLKSLNSYLQKISLTTNEANKKSIILDLQNKKSELFTHTFKMFCFLPLFCKVSLRCSLVWSPFHKGDLHSP